MSAVMLVLVIKKSHRLNPVVIVMLMPQLGHHLLKRSDVGKSSVMRSQGICWGISLRPLVTYIPWEKSRKSSIAVPF